MTGLFYGAGTAVVTPFRGGKVDYEAFGNLIKKQLEAKIAALIVAGTTGEASTLTESEKIALVEQAKEMCKGKIPVIAGAGANNTETCVKNAAAMEKAGADAILCVTPYYNMCSREGLKAHFLSVANAVSLPVILYNVPARTGVSLEADTAGELFKHPRIPAVKEAASDFAKAMKMANLSMDGAYVYSGNDNMTLALMALGACGVMSVVSNAAPEQMHRMTDACLSGDFEKARKENMGLMPLMDLMKADVNPIPIKAVLSVMGLIQNEMRLPLTPLAGEKMKAIEEFVKNHPEIS